MIVSSVNCFVRAKVYARLPAQYVLRCLRLSLLRVYRRLEADSEHVRSRKLGILRAEIVYYAVHRVIGIITHYHALAAVVALAVVVRVPVRYTLAAVIALAVAVCVFVGHAYAAVVAFAVAVRIDVLRALVAAVVGHSRSAVVALTVAVRVDVLRTLLFGHRFAAVIAYPVPVRVHVLRAFFVARDKRKHGTDHAKYERQCQNDGYFTFHNLPP